jgi:hypothetical protein
MSLAVRSTIATSRCLTEDSAGLALWTVNGRSLSEPLHLNFVHRDTSCLRSGSDTDLPFLENLTTAAALGQVSESAMTWQIFRKMEYAAGMPQHVLSAAREQGRAIGPAGAAMGFFLTCPAPPIFHRWLTYGGTDRLIFGTLTHEQIGRTRAYVITKWRQSEIQQVKEAKVPPPRTHGKVGDPGAGQSSAVR